MKIETDRLVMTAITEQDWELFLALHTNSKVIELCFDRPNVEEVLQKFEARLEPWYKLSGAWLCLALKEKLTGQAIGITGFRVEQDQAEVGYLLLPEFHGKQYGTESLKALLNWGHCHQNIGAFKAVVTEGNIGSERVLHKCGFELESIIPMAYEIGGKYYADHVYRRVF